MKMSFLKKLRDQHNFIFGDKKNKRMKMKIKYSTHFSTPI